MRQLLALSNQVGPIIRLARRSAGLSQLDVAKHLGISQKRISAMELNPGSINLEQFLALCSLLQLELFIQTKELGSCAAGARGA
jgi:HTH-type transcriptional regulator/antitoxin HipB